MRTASMLAVVVFVGTASVAFAADPAQTDFDACNRIAQSKSNPSASPQTAARPGAPAQRSTAGPQAAPSPQPAGQARVANQADQLRGIADTAKDDPAYQQAYRDCMKGRGF